jgi:hypothetical protein
VQSAILGVKYPAFNEPGVEQSAGTPQGDRTARYSDNGGYEPLRVATLQFAMVDVLRQPPPGFEEVVRKHFRLKRHHIMAVCQAWLQEAAGSEEVGALQQLQSKVEDLQVELLKLGPSPCDVEVKEEPPAKQEGAGEGEDATAATAAAGEERVTEAMLDEMASISPNMPRPLLAVALEKHGLDLQKAINWVFTEGEAYLFEHVELFE